MRKLLVLLFVVFDTACSDGPDTDADPALDPEIVAWTAAALPIFESQSAILEEANAITDIHTPAMVWAALSDRWGVTVNQQERLAYPPLSCLSHASERWLASSDYVQKALDTWIFWAESGDFGDLQAALDLTQKALDAREDLDVETCWATGPYPGLSPTPPP